jgi:hypothetical protein
MPKIIDIESINIALLIAIDNTPDSCLAGDFSIYITLIIPQKIAGNNKSQQFVTICY